MDLENTLIKNTLQLWYNQVRGEVIEINIEETFSNITLKVGKANPRLVNLTGKSQYFQKIISGINVGEKILAKFYISSNKKNDRYYTTATLLEAIKTDEAF
jgi:hypothetical protein